MNTVKKILREYNKYLNSNGRMLEADKNNNDYVEEMILAFANENKECWLGKFNYQGDERKQIISNIKDPLAKYNGETIYTFSSDFCIPMYDKKLSELIRDWNIKPSSIGAINKIYRRIKYVGGIYYMWS